MIDLSPKPVEFLILGAGWISRFLIPLLQERDIDYAATTTTGHDGTIPFKYDPDSDSEEPFKRLPSAATILITFPLKGKGPSARLTKLYKQTHQDGTPNFIQLGATTIWNQPGWQDENSPYDTSNQRAIAEDELMQAANGAVLNLAGLYGGARQPRDWVDRVIKTKADLKAKGALHLIHGEDVARAIIALHSKFVPRKRWLLCDLHVYDWWDLVQDWATTKLRGDRESGSKIDERGVARQEELLAWVGELMVEEGIRALPRDTPRLGRVLDGRAFWRQMGLWPIRGRVR